MLFNDGVPAKCAGNQFGKQNEGRNLARQNTDRSYTNTKNLAVLFFSNDYWNFCLFAVSSRKAAAKLGQLFERSTKILLEPVLAGRIGFEMDTKGRVPRQNHVRQ